ncbi:unnamed product [Ostreococcus tauri]|uniref:Unnamed product n=1 Tax=Ostreococcus tauri TaxID=70448 RepID=A0A090N3Z2_OSTTA|nr:unnamed product [Ostreococcus tauri]CEF98963.1 unnamed product [Ostreococcus tauri]|eukprot:XP_022839568.1 unnamed product [Ostreococcus tauri]
MTASPRPRAWATDDDTPGTDAGAVDAVTVTTEDASTRDGDKDVDATRVPRRGADDDGGDGARDGATDDDEVGPRWWTKVDRAPIGARGVEVVIPRGPYGRGRDAAAALKRLAVAEGRSVKTCTTRHSGSRGVLMCKGVEDFKKSGRRELRPGRDCAYAAVIERWKWKRDGAPGTFWITEYVPHTHALCTSSKSLPSKAIAADARINAFIKDAGAKVKGEAIASAVRDALGVAITMREASRVKHYALREVRDDDDTPLKPPPS